MARFLEPSTSVRKEAHEPMPFKAHIDTLICRSRRLLTLALATVVAGPALAGWNMQPEDIAQHSTWIYTPSTAMPDGKHPLLIVLHGCDQTHDQIKNFGNLTPTAEANGAVVAIPSVGNEVFGPGCWDYNLAQDDKQHMSEIVVLANTLKSRTSLNINRDHVYIVGLSSGAAMALVIGCKEATYTDALAVILLDGTGTVYLRSPMSELTCPLRKPVCTNNAACR